MILNSIQNKSLSQFLTNVYEFVESSIDENILDLDHKNLLKLRTNLWKKKFLSSPASDPISILYLITKANNKVLDKKIELVGAFFLLYASALDVWDDVQDDDLIGKPEELEGSAIGINNGISFQFLALDMLRQAFELQNDFKTCIRLMSAFNKASINAVNGQNLDLKKYAKATTQEEVLEIQIAKSATIGLIAEFSAILSGCNENEISKYSNSIKNFTKIIQIIDDVRDIFGKKISPDLTANKMTFPIACFKGIATNKEIELYENFIKNLPSSLGNIQELLYKSGSIQKCAEVIEELRISVHKEMASLNNSSPSIRFLLHIVDTHASSLYPPSSIDESQYILQPKGEWHEHVKKLANEFSLNMKDFNPPNIPLLLPLHLPQWMYDAKRNVIFYPDIEGQAEEILPLQANMFGIYDLYFVKEIMTTQSPLYMAHEFFHYWRDNSGKLTEDFWYEEWVANNLATAYIKAFFPELVKKTILLAYKILDLKNSSLSFKGQEILNRFSNPNYKASSEPLGYEVNLDEMTFIQISMIRKLYNQELSLDEVVKKFLC
ncbi:MAG: polyprenyl synthetase family protein [Cyanobacteriota bacterium]